MFTPAVDNDRTPLLVVDVATHELHERQHRQFVGNFHVRPLDVVEVL